MAFLGGTIGNLLPAERAKFLSSLRDVLEPGEWLLLGTDLVKDPETVRVAYDDAAGVTARFNKNVLVRLNRELGAEFDLDLFHHVARWNGTGDGSLAPPLSDPALRAAWLAQCARWREALASQDDLATRLLRFVEAKR